MLHEQDDVDEYVESSRNLSNQARTWQKEARETRPEVGLGKPTEWTVINVMSLV
jgi:hypothetical protein